jgi:hypothetical protein
MIQAALLLTGLLLFSNLLWYIIPERERYFKVTVPHNKTKQRDLQREVTFYYYFLEYSQ